MELLTIGLVFLATFGGVFALMGREPQGAVARLHRHRMVPMGGAAAVVATPRTPILGVGPSSGALGELAARLAGRGIRTKAAKLLREAGDPMSVGRFLLLRAVFAFVAAPAYVLFALQTFGVSRNGLVLGGVGLMVLLNLPLMVVRRKARKRAKAIELAMPDALDLLVVCVEGGLSLDGSIQQVAHRTSGVLTLELRKMLGELQTGMSRRDAFQNLAARSQSQSLQVFCTAIVQADKMGTSLAGTLRTLAATMRTRRRQAAETQARKAPIKMLPFLVLFMIPSLFIVILTPAILSMIEFFGNTG